MSDNIISIQYDSDIAKGNDAVRISFYANIGFFIEVAFNHGKQNTTEIRGVLPLGLLIRLL